LQKRPRGGSRPRSEPRNSNPLEIGQEVRDVREKKVGVIVEFACQYAHPKAQPVYNYLIRWQDGQVQAVAESALTKEYGLELKK
jgi:hypothetical protein